MKKINSNNWAPRNKRTPHATPYIPITNPPLVNVDNLYYSFYVYNNAEELAIFYYILYDFLGERVYFYEDD